ncbi:MAG: hypothetical protein KAJ42_13405 [Gemmatimonadetes bacterium]|nr:hypothetical protein [Gemmatimonadota bacterium]
MRRQPTQPCPECKGSGRVPYVFEGKPKERECHACEGFGHMSRMQANNYYGEGGVLDAEEDRAAEDRAAEEAAEEQDRLDREEYGP